MGDIVDRAPLTRAIKTALNAVMGSSWGSGTIDRFDVGRAPQTVPKDDQGMLLFGYGIIYPIVSPGTWGTMSSPEDVLTAVYQITYVGRSDDHAQALADQGHFVMVGRGPNGQFVTPVTPGSGFVVIERRTRERGGPTEESGALWNVVDVYELETQANAA